MDIEDLLQMIYNIYHPFYKTYYQNQHQNQQKSMLIQFPNIEKFIRLLFLFSISGYSFGITYLQTTKYYIYGSFLWNTLIYIFGNLPNRYIYTLWDEVIHGLLFGYYIGLCYFVLVFGFLIHCHMMGFIDQRCMIYIPLPNMKYITLQYGDHQYQITLDMAFTWSDFRKYWITKIKSND